MPGPNPDHEEALLDALSKIFLRAVQRIDVSDVDGAEDLLRDVLRQEPRLAEPNLTLGRLLLDTDRLEESEERTRTAITLLNEQGTWTDEVPENVVKAIAHAQLAETLRRRADEDDVIFGDPATFQALMKESQENFALAATLDPTDETSSYYAFFMGPTAST